MKIKTLETDVTLRFKLKNSELETAAEDVRKYYKLARENEYDEDYLTSPNRKLTIFKKGEVSRTYHDEMITAYEYAARIDYSPAIRLTKKLVDFELFHLESITDLPFRDNTADVTPSELCYFKKPWHYGLSYGKLKKGKEPEAEYTVGIRIMGFLDDKKQIKELKSMADHLYLPVACGKGSWQTDTGHGGTGGSFPTIVLDKKFKGYITPEAEKEINEFYNNILSFVLKYETTEGFRFEKGGKTWAEIAKEEEGFDMHDHIASSTACKNSFYAPSLRIDALIPVGNVRPELCYKNGKCTKQSVTDLMHLTAFAESVFPEKHKTKGGKQKWQVI